MDSAPTGAVDVAVPVGAGTDAVAARRERLFSLDHALAAPLPRGLTLAAIVAFGVWHVATNVWLTEPALWQNAIHFAGFALIAALTTRAWGSGSQSRVAFAANLLFGVAIAASALWIAHAENGLYERTLARTGLSWQFRPLDWAAALIVVGGVIELTRRLTGWIIPALIAFSLAYILFLGEMLPGAFRAASLPLDDVLFRSLYNDEGMFGVITTISSSNITLFMIFGAFLVVSGGVGLRHRAVQDRRRAPARRGGLRRGDLLGPDRHDLGLRDREHRLHRRHHDPADEVQRLPRGSSPQASRRPPRPADS